LIAMGFSASVPTTTDQLRISISAPGMMRAKSCV